MPIRNLKEKEIQAYVLKKADAVIKKLEGMKLKRAAEGGKQRDRGDLELLRLSEGALEEDPDDQPFGADHAGCILGSIIHHDKMGNQATQRQLRRYA